MARAHQTTRMLKDKLIQLIIIGVLAMLAVGYVGLHYIYVEKATTDRLPQYTQGTVNTFVSKVNSYISDTRKEAAKQAASLKAKIAASNLQESDHYLVNAAVDENGAKLYVFNDQKIQEANLISYAGIQMAERLLDGTRPFGEIVAIKESGEWQILVSEPVKGPTERNTGAIYRISADGLLNVLKSYDKLEGRLELKQSIPGDYPADLFVSGTPGDYPATTQSTENSEWSFEFTPSDYFVEKFKTEETWFTTVFSIYCGFLLIAAYLLIRVRGLQLSIRWDAEEKQNRFSNFVWTKGSGKRTEDEELLGDIDDIDLPEPSPEAEPTLEESNVLSFPSHVFRSNDIRGLAGSEIDNTFARRLGMAIGTFALNSDNKKVYVGRDGRKSSEGLCKHLVNGLLSTGCNVADLGLITTPMLNFAVARNEEIKIGIVVTASHNPGDYNGFKIIHGDTVIDGESFASLKAQMESDAFLEGSGKSEEASITAAYIKAISDDISCSQKLNIAIDCSNAVPCVVAPDLFQSIGCKVFTLHDKLDGNFPNHDPDPIVPENLEDLRDLVMNSSFDLGLAFDGDGDRIVAIAPSGRVVWPDELLLIFAKDLLKRKPGSDVVFDVKSTKRLPALISSFGGRAIMAKTGHANIRRKLAASEAQLAGEFSGHLFFRERWYGFDDGLYAAARLIEILTITEKNLDQLIEEFPPAVASPEIRIPIPDNEKFALVDSIVSENAFGSAHCSTIDGLRVEYPEGWGLIRASNTGADLTLRFEAKSEEHLSLIKQRFIQALAPYINDIASYI